MKQEAKVLSQLHSSRHEKRPQFNKDEFVRSDAGTLMGNLLRSFWQPVALAGELMPSKAIPIRVMGEDLTLYRGENGTPYIVAARCAHRVSLLHTGWVEGDCIRCFYHGWKYDGTGQCVEAPAEKSEFAKKIKIASYPAQEYGGLIFAYMGKGNPPEFPKKAELDRSFGVKYSYSFIWPCNWFQRIENSIDATHVSFVHRRSTLGTAVRSDIPELKYEETEWGIRQTASRGPDNIRISEILFRTVTILFRLTDLSQKRIRGPIFLIFLFLSMMDTPCSSVQGAPH